MQVYYTLGYFYKLVHIQSYICLYITRTKIMRKHELY